MKVSSPRLLALRASSRPPRRIRRRRRPTFRSAVDLVPVDVNVIDKNGRPVADLGADDFTLTVDGKPRRIASAQFISVERAIDSAPPKPMEYNSNAGAAGGRLVMLVDRRRQHRRRPRQAGDRRGEAVHRHAQPRRPRRARDHCPAPDRRSSSRPTTPSSRSSLESVVGPGDRTARCRRTSAWRKRSPSSAATTTSSTRSSTASAARIRPRLDRAAACSSSPAKSQQLLLDARERTRNSLIALRYLFERVATSETPKTIVFISEGLLLDRDYTDVAWVGPRASAAHITLYILQLDAPEMDAALPRHVAVARRGSRGPAPGPRPARRDGARRRVPDRRQRRLRVPAAGAGAVRLLPSQLRAAAGRPRRQAAQDRDRCPPQGPDAAIAPRVQRRPGRVAHDRGRRARHAAGAAARTRYPAEAHDLHLSGSRLARS